MGSSSIHRSIDRLIDRNRRTALQPARSASRKERVVIGSSSYSLRNLHKDFAGQLQACSLRSDLLDLPLLFSFSFSPCSTGPVGALASFHSFSLLFSSRGQASTSMRRVCVIGASRIGRRALFPFDTISSLSVTLGFHRPVSWLVRRRDRRSARLTERPSSYRGRAGADQ